MTDITFLQWPFFGDSHRELAIHIDAWAKANVERLVEQEHHDLDRTCTALVHALGEGGWTRYAVPASAGGQFEKLDVRSLCLIRETLARYHALADFAFAMQGLGSGPITLFGSAEQQARFLPGIAEGKKLAAFALSEPEAGSDIAALVTTATFDDGHYVINGEKTWISNGGIADFYLVFARTGEAPGTRGLSCFIVEADNLGLEVEERIELIAPHPLARLTFNDCRIPQDNLVGEAGRGFAIAMATLDVFRTTVGAAALGFARRALDETLAHATHRKLFGGTLSDLQLVQGKLADMALQIDAAALLVYRSAWTKDVTGNRVTREAAMAKLYATEMAQKVVDTAVQLHGGKGLTKGEVVESLYRDVRALRIYEGASEIQQMIIARQLLSDRD